MVTKSFISIEDYPGGIGGDIYWCTKSNGILIDVSIMTRPTEVWVTPEPTEETPEPDPMLIGWNVDVGMIGCARQPTEENALKQFGYAARQLGIELSREKALAALYASL